MWAPHFKLATWLLRQKAAGAASPFAPYLAILPTHFASPLLFPDRILHHFQSQEYIDRVRMAH